MNPIKIFIFLALLSFLQAQAKPTSRRMASRRSSSSSYDSPGPFRKRPNNNGDDRINSYLMKNNYKGYDDTTSRRRRRRSIDVDTGRLKDMLDRKIANSVGELFRGFDFAPVKNGLQQNKIWVSIITILIGFAVFFAFLLKWQGQKQKEVMFNVAAINTLVNQNAKKNQDTMRRLRYIKEFGQAPDLRRWKVKNLKQVYN